MIAARLAALAGAPRRRVALAAALGSLTVICGAALMALAGYLISRAAERPEILSLMTVIVGVRFFGIARPLVRYTDRLVSHDLALRVLGRVRVRVWARIEPLAPAGLAAFRQGDLLTRMVADVDALQNLYLRVLGPPLVALGAGATLVLATALILPPAALVLAAGLAVAGVAVPALTAAAVSRAGARQRCARAGLTAELVEALGHGPELVAYGAQDAALARVAERDGRLVRLARRDALTGGAADGLMAAITGSTVAGVLAVAVSASATGRLDRTLVAALALLALAAFEAVAPLTATAREASPTLAAGRRVLALTDRAPEVSDPEVPLPAPVWPFAVALENVRARYAPGEEAALDGFSLRLVPRARVALVGPSGAGKTTVVNLLLRFLDPEAGRVVLAGCDLRKYRQADVRRAIAVAGQDAHLFSASIRDNLALARPDATDAEVAEVLRLAQLWPWVAALPDGLDTHVGEQGSALSGGQRQRLVLARALLTGAPILVLDEPTAHLDPPTATALVHDVFAAAGDRTVLLITHRPEGLDLVDEVVSLGLRRARPASAGSARR